MKFYDLLEKDTQLVRKKGNNGSKTKKPLSGKTILEHHRLLRAMLHRAVYWQLIVSNPAERVQPPRAKKPKRRSYDDEQTKILLENLEKLTVEDTKYKVAIILTIFTGCLLYTSCIIVYCSNISISTYIFLFKPTFYLIY